MKNASSAWILGKNLNAARKFIGKGGHEDDNGRIAIAPYSDSYELGAELEHGFPFVLGDDLFVTIHDFDLTTSPARFVAHNEIMALANVRLTRRALDSALSESINEEIKETCRIETFARSMDLDNIDQVYEFSKQVCEWGDVPRVWGNLKRFHPNKQELGEQISRWLHAISQCERPSEAIEPGTKIKGLGISFASKHLRLYKPERFATLDAVISDGLGYALNGAGYNLWLRDLEQFKQYYNSPLRIADIEYGIFILMRQIVRAKS